MTAQQIRFEMLRRAQQFLDARPTELDAVNATKARKELDQLVAEMGVNDNAQATSTLNARNQTAEQRELRHALMEHHMRPVATIAAAHLHDVPGFKALALPPKGVRVAVLIATAAAMAEAARAEQQLFVENGRPENFADVLLSAAAAVRESIDARGREHYEQGSSAGGTRDRRIAGARGTAVARCADAERAQR